MPRRSLRTAAGTSSAFGLITCTGHSNDSGESARSISRDDSSRCDRGSIRERLSVDSMVLREQGVPDSRHKTVTMPPGVRLLPATEVTEWSATYVSGPGGVSLDLCENLTTQGTSAKSADGSRRALITRSPTVRARNRSGSRCLRGQPPPDREKAAATHNLVRLVVVAGVSRRRCLLVCFGCHGEWGAIQRVPLWLRAGEESGSKQGRQPRVLRVSALHDACPSAYCCVRLTRL